MNHDAIYALYSNVVVTVDDTVMAQEMLKATKSKLT
jgi:hypothetical protein